MAGQQKDRWGIPSHQDLPRSARQRAIAQRARALTPDEYRGLHAHLDGGDEDDRHTALFLATVRRDLDRVVAALHDPALRARALAAAGRLPVPDEALAEVARTAPQAHRLALYRQLRRTGRRELADRLMPEVHERYGRREAARLLVACSPEAVHPWLSRLVLGDGVLVALARSAPLALVTHLAGQYGGVREADARRGLNRRLITSAVRRDPEAGFHLLATEWRLLTADAVSELLAVRPAGVVDAIRAQGIEELPLPEGELTARAVRAVGRLPEDGIVLLARTCRPARGGGRRWGLPVEPLLALLEPERRAQVAAEVIGAPKGGTFPAAGLVLALGPERRAERVRTYLAARSGGRRVRLAGVLRLLPLAEAEQRLTTVAGSPRHYERAAGWGALLDCAAVQGDPAEYARIVRLAERAWHDHPEVRQTVLRRMAGAPAALIAAVPTEVLRDAALTVVQARDTTVHCLEPLALWLRRTVRRAVADRDLPRVVELTGLLAQLAGHPRAARGGPAELGLSGPVAERVWESLHATAAMRRPGRWLRLAALLPPLPQVDARLEEYLLGGHEDGNRGVARAGLREEAAALWLRSSLGRDERCGRLVGADPESVRIDAVWQVLAGRRTDLLAEVFAGARKQGLAWAPPLPAGAGPQAAAAHAALVGPAVFDEEAELVGRVAAAGVSADPAVLREAVGAGPQPVAAAAVRRLASVLPPAQALPLVVPHLGGGGVRGRAAALAVRHLLTRSAEAEAEALLAGRLTDAGARVGVGAGKELVAALGDLSDGVVLRTALTVWDSPDLHTDVRARLAALLTGFLDRPEVVERLLDGLSESTVWEAVSRAGGRERDLALRSAREEFLSAATAHPDADVACGAFVALRGWAGPEGPGVAAAVRELLTFDRPGRVWRAAVLLFADEGQPGQAVVGHWTRVVDELTRLATGGGGVDGAAVGGGDGRGPVAGADLARAARVRLLELTGARHGPEVHAPALLDVLTDRLEAAGLGGAAACTALVLAGRALAAGDPAPERWSRVLGLIEGHPLRWAGLPEDCGLRWGDDPPEQALRPVLSRLRTGGTEAATLLGATLVAWITDRVRPPDWWQEELALWRAHPDPDAAELVLVRR